MARQRIAHTAKKTREHMLLATKLFIPAPTSTLVARPRLVALLTAGARSAATLVSAPAGWGKTTLLSAWHADLSGSGYPFAWVSLDASDNDPVRFWSYVLVAMNTLYEGASDAALTLLRSPQPPPVVPVLTSVLNAFTTLSKDAVLVLDDYQVIETQPIHHAMTYLLEHLPPRLHLVIATRVDPPLPLARLRVRGVLTEIRAIDLRFTPVEAGAFLTETMGLPLTAEQVSALEERTEGWIVGLQLAALSAQGRTAESMGKFIEAFTGSNRYVVEYLAEEVLEQQTDETQTFLLRTAVLDRMCAPLCDAVLTREQGEARYNQTLDAHIHLEQLERANLFLIPLDDEKNWYRYHHLFADVLRSRLRQTQPRLVPELHRSASVWYEQHEMLAEAVQHALAAPDVELAARLIEQYGLAVALRGQVHLVLGWLNALPDTLVHSNARLCLYYALMLMFTHQLEAAEARVSEAEQSVRQDMPTNQTCVILGWVAGIRANLARFSGDLARCVTLSHQTLELLPETEEMLRAAAALGPAQAFLVSGDVTAEVERLIAATAAPLRATGDLFALLTSITFLARLQVLQGRLREAAATYEQVLHLVGGQELLRLLVGSPAYYFGMGDMLREWNKLDAAEDYLTQGMDHLRGTLSVDAEVVTLGYITQARLNWERGDYSMALAMLDEFEQLVRRCNFVAHLRARGFAVRAQVDLAQGSLAAAAHRADTCGLSAQDDLSYVHEREYLTLARVLIAQGRNDQARHLLQNALHLLKRLLHDAEIKARMHSAIEILVLSALASQALGDSIEALTALKRAVVLGESEGYVRIFLDEGEAMLHLLSRLLATGYGASTYIQTLIAAGAKHMYEPATPLFKSKEPHSRSSQPLLDPLSERELEVLYLVANGDSNCNIAEQLFVAVSTVKRHVSNIFSKLGVTNRTQAVARAREFGIL